MDNLKTIENFISVLEHYGIDIATNNGKKPVLCPFHDDHKPSLSVNLDEGYFKCFGCDAKGDIYSFIALQEKLDTKKDFTRIREVIKSICGIQEEKPDKALIARYQYIVDGKIVNVKAKFSDKSFYWMKSAKDGGQFPIYNVDALKNATQIVIAEGEKDCDTLLANGITAISFPHGAENVKEEYVSPLLSLKIVYIAYDNDPAGENGTDKITALLKRNGFAGQIFTVRWIDKPAGYDVTDWFGETTDPNKNDSFFKLFQEYKAISINKYDYKWPEPLSELAYYGLAGRIVKAIEPHTEADNAALLGHFLVMFGNAIGRHPHFIVEGSKHYTNLYMISPGDTSRGRKGSAYSQLKRMFKRIDPEWVDNNIELNCSTGEGIVNRVRDALTEKVEIKDNGSPTGEFRDEIVDCGIEDKRLLLVEQEFASFLKLATREGNNLSPIVRMAWDSGHLGILTKHNPLKAKNAHISIIAHITKNELLRYLTTTEACNGFANRFLWICSKRSKLLPHGGTIDPVSNDLIKQLHYVIEWAKTIDEIPLDDNAKSIWEKVYPAFEKPELPELVAAITSRGEAQTRRIAMLYAILDMSKVVKKEHLLAALELWRYCEDSVKYIYENMCGNPIAETIKTHLKKSKNGLTRTEISSVFYRNKPKEEIDIGLLELLHNGLIECRKGNNEGRPEERWFYVGK